MRCVQALCTPNNRGSLRTLPHPLGRSGRRHCVVQALLRGQRNNRPSRANLRPQRCSAPRNRAYSHRVKSLRRSLSHVQIKRGRNEAAGRVVAVCLPHLPPSYIFILFIARLVTGDIIDEDVHDPLDSLFAFLSEKRDKALTQEWGVWLLRWDTERAMKVRRVLHLSTLFFC